MDVFSDIPKQDFDLEIYDFDNEGQEDIDTDEQQRAFENTIEDLNQVY